MSYAVKEIFLTLQGEGAHAGRRGGVLPFLRLQSLERPRAGSRAPPSASSATPTSWAPTARWAAVTLPPRRWPIPIAAQWTGQAANRYVVLTGGEPLLQVDRCVDRRPARAWLRDRRRDQRHASPRRTASTGSASARRPAPNWWSRQRSRAQAGVSAGGCRRPRLCRSGLRAVLAAADGRTGRGREHRARDRLLPATIRNGGSACRRTRRSVSDRIGTGHLGLTCGN